MSHLKLRVAVPYLHCKRGTQSLSISKNAVSMLNFLMLRLPLASLIGQSRFRITRVAFLPSTVPWFRQRQRGLSPNRILWMGLDKSAHYCRAPIYRGPTAGGERTMPDTIGFIGLECCK